MQWNSYIYFGPTYMAKHDLMNPPDLTPTSYHQYHPCYLYLLHFWIALFHFVIVCAPTYTCPRGPLNDNMRHPAFNNNILLSISN